MSLSPLSVNPTTEGVIREPEEFTRTFGDEPSITATTEFVVPRSIPIILAIFYSFRFIAYSQYIENSNDLNVQKVCQLEGIDGLERLTACISRG